MAHTQITENDNKKTTTNDINKEQPGGMHVNQAGMYGKKVVCEELLNEKRIESSQYYKQDI